MGTDVDLNTIGTHDESSYSALDLNLTKHHKLYTLEVLLDFGI